MKLGIMTDIHEHLQSLDAALSIFQSKRVDQVIVIGDLFKTGELIEQTCQRLREANAIGVWGNHDYSLCQNVEIETRRKYSDNVLDFMSALHPRLELEGCHFMHNEPWLNPNNLQDLWYLGGPPSQVSDLPRIFDAVPSQLMFGGHYHRFMLMSPSKIHAWHGERAIQLDDDRYFVVIGALFEGNFAILNTETRELIPFAGRST